MDKKTFIAKSLSVALGLILGALCLWGIYTQYQDHKALGEVVSFLNAQISASQKASVSNSK